MMRCCTGELHST